MKRIISFILIVLLASSLHAADLGKAISEGNLEKVKAILKENPSLLNSRENLGLTPLMFALNEQQPAIAIELIKSGADVTIGDNENSMPVHLAASIGNIELFELILSKGVSMETRDDNGLTPLLFAIKGKQPVMSKYLIDKGANVRVETKTKWTGLLYCAIYGQTETAKILIAKKADVNAKSTEGIVPLHSAVSFGRTEMVKLLVDNGARIDEKTSQLETPVFWARNPNTYDAAKYLIDKGASVTIKNKLGMTPLMSVAGRGSVNVAELFLQHGADINAVDSNGFTALGFAAWSRNPDAMSKFLIMNGADVNPPVCTHEKTCGCGPAHTTPLNVAADAGQLAMVKNLVSNGAKINVYNQAGLTPLLQAVRNGNFEVVKYLVEHGAFLNQKDRNLGYTELLLSVALGREEMVSYFLEKGSDVSITNNDGKNALDLAWYYGHKEIAYSLLADGANDAKLKELVNQPSLLAQAVNEKEANVWFLGQSSWAVKTKNHFLVFDYAKNPDIKTPADSCLSSGFINTKELEGLKVMVFATHSHGDHYSKEIFKWKSNLPGISYVLCFNPPDSPGEFNYIPIHGEKTIDGVKISTVKSTDLDGGYLVEVDGLVIFHPGDLANGQDKLMKAYTDEIDWVSAKGVKVDLAFAPIRGCSLGQPPQVRLGVSYMVDKLQPKLLIPMHAGATTQEYKLFADDLKKTYPDQKIQVVVNTGDRFSYMSL